MKPLFIACQQEGLLLSSFFSLLSLPFCNFLFSFFVPIPICYYVSLTHHTGLASTFLVSRLKTFRIPLLYFFIFYIPIPPPLSENSRKKETGVWSGVLLFIGVVGGGGQSAF